MQFYNSGLKHWALQAMGLFQWKINCKSQKQFRVFVEQYGRVFENLMEHFNSRSGLIEEFQQFRVEFNIELSSNSDINLHEAIENFLMTCFDEYDIPKSLIVYCVPLQVWLAEVYVFNAILTTVRNYTTIGKRRNCDPVHFLCQGLVFCAKSVAGVV